MLNTSKRSSEERDIRCEETFVLNEKQTLTPQTFQNYKIFTETLFTERTRKLPRTAEGECRRVNQ